MRTIRVHPLRRAFTLMEMLVAIGIIVILAVITVSASIALVERSEVRATQNVLTLLDTAMRQWEAESDRKITWGVYGSPLTNSAYDMYNGVPHVFTVSEVLYRIGRSDAVKPILAQIKPGVLYRFDTSQDAPGWLRLQGQGDPDPNFGGAITAYGDNTLGGPPGGRPITGMLAVLDAWGSPVRAVHPGRPFDPVLFEGDVNPDDRDEDGTIPLTVAYGTYGVEEFYGAARDRRILFVSAGPDGRFGSLGEEHDTDMHEWTHDNVYSYPVEDAHDDE